MICVNDDGNSPGQTIIVNCTVDRRYRTMCLAVPALIKSVDGQVAEVEIGRVRRSISLQLTPEARVGDYVLIHAGFAITVIDKYEALETIRFFGEMEAAYQRESH